MDHFFRPGLFRVLRPLDPGKKIVLLVTPGSSPDGAAEMTRILARGFRRTHQVVVLVVGSGGGATFWKDEADCCFEIPAVWSHRRVLLQALLRRLCEVHPFEAGILHSTVCWNFTEAFSRFDVPFLFCLLGAERDFLNLDEWRWLVWQTDRVVFPSREALHHLVDQDSVLSNARMVVVPPPQVDHPEIYQSALMDLTAEVIKEKACELADRQTILRAKLLHPDYLEPHLRSQQPEEQVRVYTRKWRSGIIPSRPFPGFNPGMYLDAHPDCRRDPLAHWFDSGQPSGLWRMPLLYPEDTAPPDARAFRGVALHIHVYYPDVVPDMLKRLLSNHFRPDLWITVSEACDVSEVAALFRDYPGRVEYVQVPNRGRDLGPLITALGPRLVRDYEIVGHIHTKKRLWHDDGKLGKVWREYLLEHMVGGGGRRMMDRILAALECDPKLGLIYPERRHLGTWDDPESHTQRLLARMGLSVSCGLCPDFPAGSFFWARTCALQPFLELGLDWADYPDEPAPNQHANLHALERLSPLVVASRGYQNALTYISGLNCPV
ncbi:MAG: rhamnan synthesis F family protein [Candidatus Methylacidiphilales bacterium]|nr:rhamnan synthesis F family protein [Candidatus Methylacidiphilales bacterium]